MTRDDYDQNGSWGILASIDLHSCNPDFIRDAEKIKDFTRQFCDLIDVTRFGECQIVHFADHDEDVAGFSMVQLIETSLVSGHFANKTNNVYLDVFSCKYYDPDAAHEFAKKFFEARDSTVCVLLRK
tara:strand:- start:4595 stop:4975 length:381 start_codon:yes stop_codon:yes gene_type:complete